MGGPDHRFSARGSRCYAPLLVESSPPSPSVSSSTGAATQWSALDEKIYLLERMGVDSGGVFSKHPSILRAPVERLEATLEFLSRCGFRGRELSRLAKHWPELLDCSVEERLQPNLDFLINEVGVKPAVLTKVLKRCPRLLAVSIDQQLRPKLKYLEFLGLTDLGTVICTNPTLLTSGIETKLKPKFDFLRSLGITHECAAGMLWRYPSIFNYSINKNLKPKYEYLIYDMGRSLEELQNFPQYFGYSLDRKIRPRHEYLYERNLRVSLAGMLVLGEEEFYERYQGDKVRGYRRFSQEVQMR